MTSESEESKALRAVVDYVAHLLPAQGPISVFIHHNLLHAFEGAPFEDAVAQAARIYGAEPFWPAQRYREMFETGRITHDDLREVLDESLGARRTGFSSIELFVEIGVAGVDAARAQDLLAGAKSRCFVANTLKCPVELRVELKALGPRSHARRCRAARGSSRALAGGATRAQGELEPCVEASFASDAGACLLHRGRALAPP